MKDFLVILLACLFVIGCSLNHQRTPKTSEDTTSAIAKYPYEAKRNTGTPYSFTVIT